MNKNTKNIIMFILLVVLIIGTYFTINATNNNKNVKENFNQMQIGEPPEKPDNDNTGNPPSKPDENLGEEDNNSNNDKEIPEKSDNNGNPPSKPGSDLNNTNSDEIDTIYYVLFFVEGLGIGVVSSYLVLSKFNNKNIKETFEKKTNIIVFIICSLVVASGLTFLDSRLVPSSNSLNSKNMMNNNSKNISYSSSKEINNNEEITSGEYTSTNADENAILISGNNTVSISNISINKTGDSDGGDNTSFYGTNSALIAKDGATVNIDNITISTDATGANGVFSYGGSATTNNSNSDGTTINISNSKITTVKDNSGGIMTTGGGKMIANNLTITTSGVSSAAIRSDRGGGNVNVTGGTYTTNGQGSPAIYSTAEIKVKDATLISNASEGIVIEGKNSVTIENVKLTDTNNKLNGQSTTYKNIFLYQSMSGDADDGESVFTAKNSTITTNKGDTLYVTNTSSTITLENNEIINNDKSGNFLRIQKDSWGKSGNNGGNVTLNLNNQEVNGNIVVDSISTLEINMKSSVYEGIINGDNTAKNISLTLDKSSEIKLTGNSYITELNNSDSNNSNIDFNGFKLYVNGVAIN